jgi:hypothetical protein
MGHPDLVYVYGMILCFAGLSALCSDIRGEWDNLPLLHRP